MHDLTALRCATLCCAPHCGVVTSKSLDHASDSSNLISAMNGFRLLVVEMRSEPSDALSDDLKVCNMVFTA
ncbi:hypothetical protein RHMOL_Rhmol01G0235800 [Rhododendron molle]|uniref:Uncharacterized protein n=1 Tax=Rhododendron molle TaxID=49168 RepID=A0ACC0Q6I8_RHOML|nr:hypothetical protein RHMOL_Rhmol01G0235800 [Rhododendron molle]